MCSLAFEAYWGVYWTGLRVRCHWRNGCLFSSAYLHLKDMFLQKRWPLTYDTALYVGWKALWEEWVCEAVKWRGLCSDPSANARFPFSGLLALCGWQMLQQDISEALTPYTVYIIEKLCYFFTIYNPNHRLATASPVYICAMSKQRVTQSERWFLLPFQSANLRYKGAGQTIRCTLFVTLSPIKHFWEVNL